MLNSIANSDSSIALSAERATKFLEFSTTRVRDGEFKPDSSLRFDTTALWGLRNVTSDAPGHVRCELPVTTRVANFGNNLHGGCTATLIDVVGSAALATISEKPGVSVHIGSEYLSGCPVGDVAIIDAQVLNMGNKLSTIQVRINSERTGKLIATGMHTKYSAQYEPELQFGTPPKWLSKL